MFLQFFIICLWQCFLSVSSATTHQDWEKDRTVCRYTLKSSKSCFPPRKGRDPGEPLPTPSTLLSWNASSYSLQTLEEEDLFIQVHSYIKESISLQHQFWNQMCILTASVLSLQVVGYWEGRESGRRLLMRKASTGPAGLLELVPTASHGVVQGSGKTPN